MEKEGRIVFCGDEEQESAIWMLRPPQGTGTIFSFGQTPVCKRKEVCRYGGEDVVTNEDDNDE